MKTADKCRPVSSPSPAHDMWHVVTRLGGETRHVTPASRDHPCQREFIICKVNIKSLSSRRSNLLWFLNHAHKYKSAVHRSMQWVCSLHVAWWRGQETRRHIAWWLLPCRAVIMPPPVSSVAWYCPRVPPCLVILRPSPNIYTRPGSQNIRDVTLDRKIRRLKARKYCESQTEGEYVYTNSGDVMVLVTRDVLDI